MENRQMKAMTLNEKLSHHCNKAIERGGVIAGIPAEIEILRADRSEYNESNGKDMAGCIARAGIVIAYFPTQSALRSAPLYASAPELLDSLRFLLADYIAIQGDKLTGSSVPLEMAQAAILKAEGVK